jgi:hypothetical protein
MAQLLQGRELENDPGGNPCFGCGPDNPIGLRLRFFDDGAVVRTSVEARPEFAGWPGSWNFPVLAAAMWETGGWAVWERLGPSRLDGPSTFELAGPPPALGAPLVVEARVPVRGDHAEVEVALRSEGRTLATLRYKARRASAEEARMMLQFPNMPRSLRPAMEARAGGR